MATLLLRLSTENKVSLDDKLAKWLPDAQRRPRDAWPTGPDDLRLPDYVLGNAEFEAAFLADPFRQWTPQQLLSYAG